MVGITLTKLLICDSHSLELQLNYCGEQKSCHIKSCWRNCGVDIAARASKRGFKPNSIVVVVTVESLRELAKDIRRLMTLAYPGEKSSLAEHIAREVFLMALNAPEFELKIQEREPVDLDEALKLAQRFEVFKSAGQVAT